MVNYHQSVLIRLENNTNRNPFIYALVLPEHPVVLNRWGRQLNGTLLGPKEEGDDILLTCRVIGGK